MVTNTTPKTPTHVGKKSRFGKGVDPREPLKTDMDSAREHGDRSPQKGKCVEPVSDKD